jgi:hypothetical protein
MAVDRLEVEQFNLRFLLAASHYLPSVGLALIRQCRADIELLGYEYAQERWSAFIENTLTGETRGDRDGDG